MRSRSSQGRARKRPPTVAFMRRAWTSVRRILAPTVWNTASQEEVAQLLRRALRVRHGSDSCPQADSPSPGGRQGGRCPGLRSMSCASAANQARSVSSYRTQPARLRSTAFSCRSISGPASFARSLRNTRTAGPLARGRWPRCRRRHPRCRRRAASLLWLVTRDVLTCCTRTQ